MPVAKKKAVAKKAVTKKAVVAKKTVERRPRTAVEREEPRYTVKPGGRYFAAPKTNLKFIPTGCTTMDLAMGGGGWCRGRVANIVGDKSTGKTLVMIEACANFARTTKGKIHYWEAEAAFDKGYANALGMPIDRIDFWDNEKDKKNGQLDTVEDFFERIDWVIDDCKKTGKPALVILDSLDSLSDRAEMKRKVGEGTYGTGKAKQLSELFRRCVRDLERYDITLLIVSQVRDNIGAMFGDKHKRSGGRALDFYATHVIYLAHMARITKTLRGQKRAIGVEVKAQVKKNKVGLAFREAHFDIRFGYGTDDIQSCIDWLLEIKSLPKEWPPKAIRKDGKTVNYLEEVIFKMTPEESRNHIGDIHDLVAREWWSIENDMITTRHKYADADA